MALAIDLVIAPDKNGEDTNMSSATPWHALARRPARNLLLFEAAADRAGPAMTARALREMPT